MSRAERPSDERRDLGAEAEATRVCRHLRTKNAFGASAEGDLWRLGRSTTAAYWCLLTMEPFGPDSGFCHPHECGTARGCYRSRDD